MDKVVSSVVNIEYISRENFVQLVVGAKPKELYPTINKKYRHKP